MFFAIAAAALVAFSQVAVATPLASAATTVKPTLQSVTLPANSPIHDIESVTAQPNVTLGAHGVHIDAADAIFPATLLLCPTVNCVSCFGFDLTTLPVNTCLIDLSSSFESVAISQPSNQGLPFAVVVGTTNCASLLQIPVVNECFNLNAVLDNFAIIE